MKTEGSREVRSNWTTPGPVQDFDRKCQLDKMRAEIGENGTKSKLRTENKRRKRIIQFLMSLAALTDNREL